MSAPLNFPDAGKIRECLCDAPLLKLFYLQEKGITQAIADLLPTYDGRALALNDVIDIDDCRKLSKVHSWECSFYSPVDYRDFELISSFPELSELWITTSEIENATAKLFALSETHPGMKKLSFKYTSNFEDERTGQTVLDIFRQLESLKIRSSSVSSESMTRLFHAALGHPCLKTLSLSGTGSKNGLLPSAAEYLEKGGQVEALSLREASVTADSLNSFSEALLKSTHVKTLSLADMKCLSKERAELGNAASFLQLLSEHPSIVEIDLSKCRLEAAQWEIVAQHLTQNETLRKVKVSDTKIGEGALKHFCQAIQAGWPIEHLHCHSSKIKLEGLLKLIEACTEKKQMRRLDISWNSTNNEGGLGLGKAIAELLRENTKLEMLNLSNVHLGPEGVSEVIEALKSNSSVESIYLQGTGANPEVPEKAIELVEENSHLAKLYIGSNGLSRHEPSHRDFAARLREVQKRHDCSFGIDFDYFLDADYAEDKERQHDAAMNCVIS